MSPCPVCDGVRFADALVAYDRTVARAGEFLYRRCLDCRLLSQHPLPSADEDLRAFYPDDYSPHERPVARRRDLRPWSRLVQRALRANPDAPLHPLERRALLALARIVARDVVPPRGCNRLLDVGCGAGALLARYRALGWDVRGIEPDARAVARCRAAALPVVQADLLDAPLPERHFDVILLNHVLEHVRDPAAALARARALLAPSGLLVLVTPNTAGVGLRLYGTCWYALDAPRHLHLFSPSNLRQLAARAGLRVESISVRGSTRVLSRSRCYARVQGSRLPDDPDARRAAVARGTSAERDETFDRLASPLVALLARVGIGDTLRARLVRTDP